MKYSVLMSVYKNDSPEFLNTALESIYEKQTRKPDEIVVVFDGKLTPELYAVLDQFKEDKENIAVYCPQEVNRGLGEALRIGSEKCTGDYIFRMDSDDISVPERFEKQIAYIEAHPDIDVLGSDISEFDISPEEEQMRLRVCPQKHSDIADMAKRRNPMNHMTVCIKRTALDKCGGYKPLLLLEDYYLWLRMLAAGCKFANINEALVYVRVGNGFLKRRKVKNKIFGWYKLQNFMLHNKMIGKTRAAVNMFNIIALVTLPNCVINFAYKKFFRKFSKSKIPAEPALEQKTYLCSSCRTGSDTVRLDNREPICPYMHLNTGTACAKYEKIDINAQILQEG